MKTFIYLIFFCLFFTKSLQANLEWQRWVQESDTQEICKVKQDYAFKTYYTKCHIKCCTEHYATYYTER